MRAAAGLAVFGAIALAVIVVGERGGEFADGVTPTLRVAADLIAYVTPDGEIWTSRPDGTGPAKISPDGGFFTWPTWSPDARRIAFSGVLGEGNDQRTSALSVYELASRQLREVQTGQPGEAGLVAQGAPHYVSWSPDGQTLAFIVATASGLRLYVDNVDDDVPPRGVLDQAPLYLAWSPDSRHLLVHRGPDHFYVGAEDMLAVRLDIPATGVWYRVPAWEPSGGRLDYLLGDASGAGTLYRTGLEGGAAPLVEGVPVNAAFLWAPNEPLLALTDPERVLIFAPLGVRVFQRFSLYDSNGVRTGVSVEDDVVAFYWSPDSTKIAYLTPGEAFGVLRWNILEVESGDRWPLLDFVPSESQLTAFQFFDQYAVSHSVWSPDSASLVYAGRQYGGAVSAGVNAQVADTVFVVSADRNPTLDTLADGILAFWSPR